MQKSSIFIFLFVVQLLAQSPAGFPFRDKGPIPELPAGMTLQEYKQMNREITLNRIMLAVISPGYLHFYCDHHDWAWSIFALRATGAAIATYGLVDQLNQTEDFSFNFSQEKKRGKMNMLLFLGGAALNALGFAIDWAHGDWLIENERNRVLYKYGHPPLDDLKVAMGFTAPEGQARLGLQIRW